MSISVSISVLSNPTPSVSVDFSFVPLALDPLPPVAIDPMTTLFQKAREFNKLCHQNISSTTKILGTFQEIASPNGDMFVKEAIHKYGVIATLKIISLKYLMRVNRGNAFKLKEPSLKLLESLTSEKILREKISSNLYEEASMIALAVSKIGIGLCGELTMAVADRLIEHSAIMLIKCEDSSDQRKNHNFLITIANDDQKEKVETLLSKTQTYQSFLEHLPPEVIIVDSLLNVVCSQASLKEEGTISSKFPHFLKMNITNNLFYAKKSQVYISQVRNLAIQVFEKMKQDTLIVTKVPKNTEEGEMIDRIQGTLVMNVEVLARTIGFGLNKIPSHSNEPPGIKWKFNEKNQSVYCFCDISNLKDKKLIEDYFRLAGIKYVTAKVEEKQKWCIQATDLNFIYKQSDYVRQYLNDPKGYTVAAESSLNARIIAAQAAYRH